MSAAFARSPRRIAGLVVSAAGYELRKAMAFRAGFVLRDLLRGVSRPLVMIFVFQSLWAGREGETIGGLSLRDATQYAILLALVEKLLFHDRLLDLSDQIFQGYVTKYLVMPFPFFALAIGQFVQYSCVQLLAVSAFWSLGAVCLPEIWPAPASAAHGLVALGLAFLGSACLLLMWFTVHALAFWLDVVWSLLVLSRFTVLFCAGAVLPVSLMPEPVARVLEWGFPYWAVAGPIAVFTGRAAFGEAARGALVLGASLVALELIRRAVWRAGSRRYTGSGQ